MPVKRALGSIKAKGETRLANGPVVTQPPPAPCGRVKLGPSAMGPVSFSSPSPDMEYSLPSKTTLLRMSPEVSAKFQYGNFPL